MDEDKAIPLSEVIREVAGEGGLETQETTDVILGWADKITAMEQALRELGEVWRVAGQEWAIDEVSEETKQVLEKLNS